MNPIPKVSPASAWGMFICCMGVIWTWISWFGVSSGINQMLREDRTHGFAIFIPIWGNLYVGELADCLNEIIQREGLATHPVEKPNIVLCFLFVMVPWMQLFESYNRVADAYNAKYGIASAQA